MSFCECTLDADEIISELSFKETRFISEVKCEECGSVVPAGEPFFFYEGYVEIDLEEDDGLEPDWNMISCRLCHRMRQDLESMGYCILYPGLQELIERMEDESDLKDLAERRANSDMKVGWGRRLRVKRALRAHGPWAQALPYTNHLKHLETVPPAKAMRAREIVDKAEAMAEFWRKRAAWEESEE